MGGFSNLGSNGALPTAKVGDEHTEKSRNLSTTDVEKGEKHHILKCTAVALLY